ncbi:MAG: hypothetical protein ABI266_00710 [Ginsengibacter sp.]
MKQKRICLWSSPRNISTALMYSFAQRPDTIVFDEPLYAYYLSETQLDHPGTEEILASQNKDANIVIENMLKDYEKPVLFFKQMTHHLLDLDLNFLSGFSNIIFIRDPGQIISSYAQVRPGVTMEDIGIKKQWELYKYLLLNNGNPLVVDSNDILLSPERIIRKLCDKLGIPFYSQMLSWPTGPKKEDGVWAKHWYKNVHETTGFEKQSTSDRILPDYLAPLYLESKVYYENLFQHAIKA